MIDLKKLTPRMAAALERMEKEGDCISVFHDGATQIGKGLWAGAIDKRVVERLKAAKFIKRFDGGSYTRVFYAISAKGRHALMKHRENVENH